MGRRCCTCSTHHGILFPFSLCATLCHLSPNHKAQDCGEPHPPSPPSHGTPQGKIYQATKLRIAENPICPFLPPMDLPRGGPTKPRSLGLRRPSSALFFLPWNSSWKDPSGHKAQDCGGPHLLFSSSHGTPHGRIHQATKPKIAETLICPLLPPMELPRGRSTRQPSSGLWRTPSTLSSLLWTPLGEDPLSHKAQDCREPHPLFPPSHEPPHGTIH